MSCDRSASGDYELDEVIEAAETNWNGVSEDDGGIIVDGPNVSCNASRLDEGSDRVEVWRVNSDDPANCQAFIDRLAALLNG